MLENNRLPARERYLRDPVFNKLVRMLYASIQEEQYTPTELREAVILAATMYEETQSAPPRVVRPLLTQQPGRSRLEEEP